MKIFKILLAAAVLLGGFLLIGKFFLAQLSPGGTPQDGPAAIVFAAPAGFDVVRRGELAPREAARQLGELAAARGGQQVGLYFTSAGTEIYWLADRSEPAAATLRELSASPAGTRLERIWRGGLDARLAWAAEHGSFDAPGLPPVEEKNLYH